ncbi:MAG TPA: M20 aminoacylase family protein [Gammaproteobacteria bacterium]|nr:M20 aminoacylase family protein [Gammaproteobacteria bacterium]
MELVERLSGLDGQMREWRHHLHAHPELAFEERATSDFVAERLEEFGLEVTRGIAGTGLVGTLRSGDGPAVALRADLDALPLQEDSGAQWSSRTAGHMHACGHDGHTTMLLGAARYLSREPRFTGTVHFVFQPAEETGGGGDAMVRDGLFERFPVRGVYGLHNAPPLPRGCFAIRPGPMMASADDFRLRVRGRGCHAAMPDLGRDPVVAAAHIITALQTLPSRMVAATDALVVSVTRMQGGTTWNIIPEEVFLQGTVRTLKPEIREQARAAIRRVAEGVGSGLGVEVELEYNELFPVLVNHARETEVAAEAAASVVGPENVLRDAPPTMGTEDFAHMLNAMPGSYIMLGTGEQGVAPTSLHSPHYDFNDEALALGAAYWVSLARKVLGE